MDGMHCTLIHAVGLSRGAVDTDALVKEAGGYAQMLTPFILTFDRPAVGSVGVEISGWPGRVFTKIVEILTHVTGGTGACFTAAPSRHPHMSVAYACAGAEAIDALALKAALADIDQPLSATVAVDRLLVEQWHDGTRIRWNPIAEVPLAGAA
ncbi:hypothetical protein [Streptomyces sp. NPDC023838]|uniref:hypothetical protein n=1 Tax=Streptomyces sp. NPDC023838 TaxID=3154325 RepID=UPI0033FFC7C5